MDSSQTEENNDDITTENSFVWAKLGGSCYKYLYSR